MKEKIKQKMWISGKENENGGQLWKWENGVSSVFLVNFSRQVIGSEDSRIR